MAVIPTLYSRVQCWLPFPATSLIPTMATPQRSYMTSQMTPPPQVTYATEQYPGLHRFGSLQMFHNREI